MATIYNETYNQLPSPPVSPSSKYVKIEGKPLFCSEEELKKINSLIESPKETKAEISEMDILRNQYMNMKFEGVQINGEMIPFEYAIDKLHSIGSKVINKKTKDALPLRVYEIEKDTYEDFWVHPMFLSLQSFQFYKLFEEVKNNNEQGLIEIEVPSLPAFRVILYYLYSGDRSKFLEIAKSNDKICKGIVKSINYLEIDLPIF